MSRLAAQHTFKRRRLPDIDWASAFYKFFTG
jgi:hypothetical protein